MAAPDAPWRLSGDTVLAVVRSRPRGSTPALPPELDPLPGPAFVFACRYDSSPVGTYLEMGVAEPARLGWRPGWCVTAMAVTSTDARLAGKVSWGLPKELAGLTWIDDGALVRAEWPERGVVVRARRRRGRIPAWLPIRSVQRRGDGPVVVPGSMRGWLARADVEVDLADAAEAGLWPGVEGDHRGLSLTGARFVVDVARLPHGLLSTLRAPLRAPEPGTASMHPSGRLAQLVRAQPSHG